MKAISILTGAMHEKPLKRLSSGAFAFTGLKPGANERRNAGKIIFVGTISDSPLLVSLVTTPGFSPVLSRDGDNQAVSTAFHH